MCTFLNGYFYFIAGNPGKQHLFYVPAGLIGTEEAYNNIGVLPANAEWMGITSDGSGALYLAGVAENEVTLIRHDLSTDMDDRCSFPFSNVIVDINADENYFYFSSRDDENGLVTVSKVDFVNKTNGVARDMSASGKTGSVYGLALCNDGRLSLTVDRKLTWVSMDDSQ